MSSRPSVAVLFDFDGTLIDPSVGIAGAYRYAASTLGLRTLTDAEIRAVIGPPIQESMAQVFGLTGSEIDRAVVCYREYYATRGMHEFTPFVGVRELLEELRHREIALYVATSKPTIYATKMIDDLGWSDLFGAVGGAEIDGSRRHKADVIAWVLDHLRDETRVALFVGDRPEDVIGAKAHDLSCIGVSWGFGSVEQLRQAGASSIVDTVDDLLAALIDAQEAIAVASIAEPI